MPNLGCLVGTAYQTMVSELSKRLRESSLGITGSEYLVLRALYTRDGMQQCEIAEMIGKDKGAVCRTVKSLEDKLFVRTEPVSYKCLRVYLTDKGSEAKSEVMEIARERHSSLAGLLTPEELAIFEQTLRKIIQHTL